MSFIVNLSRPLIASSAQPFFPSLRPFMYNKQIFTLDRATLIYATGRPSNVHFLAARGSLSSGKPFVGKAFPTKKIGASAASNVAQGSCAHQSTKLLLSFFPSMTAHRPTGAEKQRRHGNRFRATRYGITAALADFEFIRDRFVYISSHREALPSVG